MVKRTKDNFLPVPANQAKKAITALQSFITRNRNPRDLLHDNHEIIFLHIELNQIPEIPTLKAIPVPITHPIYAKKYQSQACIIVKDPQRYWKEKFDELQLHDTPLTKVISIDKLGKNYQQFEDRRKLIREFDLFLADIRVFNMLPERLGKYFYTKKKIPGLLDLTEDPASAIRAAVGSTYFVGQRGPNFSVKIGRVDMTAKQIMRNVQDLINALPNVFPSVTRGQIRRLTLKGANSPSLPFYHYLTPQELEAYNS